MQEDAYSYVTWSHPGYIFGHLAVFPVIASSQFLLDYLYYTNISISY